MKKTALAYPFLLLLTSSLPAQSDELLALKRRLATLEKELKEARRKIFMLEIGRDTYKNVWLDPATPDKYQRLDTTTGVFLIMVKDTQPYLDGYKVALEIGNPNAAAYSGFSLKARWGKRFPEDVTKYDQWSQSIREKDFSFTETLEPGMWRKVELILVPAPKDEFGHLEFSMQTDVISLRRPTR